jgi:hypothetical protein
MFAGAVCGYLLAVVTSLFLARTLVTAPADGPLPGWLTPNMSYPMIALGVFVVAFWIWPAIGLLVGLAYGAVSDDGTSFLGSPNIYYTLVVLAVVIPQAAVACILMHRVDFWVIASIVALALTFGWLLPQLTILAE